MDDDKETFLLRLLTRPEAVDEVLSDVTTNGATYIVKSTNTVQNSRSPELFRSVAAILPYGCYEAITQGPAEILRRIADQDIGGNCPWLADELHELARALELEQSGPASAPPRRYSFTRDSLIDALTHLEVHVATSGPIAGKVLAESMADALIEALGGGTT